MQSRVFASVLSLSWVLLASSAFAEDAPLQDASDARERTFARGVHAGVEVETASGEQKQSAQETFLLGDKAFDIQDYPKALEYFSASYATVASPNSRLMIARCLLEIGRLDEAYDEYSGVMKDAEGNEDYDTTGATAKKEREALRHRLAWLTVKMGDVPVGSRLMIGGRERTTESLDEPIAVTPGKTAVKATTESGEIAEALVHLAAGRAADVELKLGETITVGEPPPPPTSAPKQEVQERQAEPPPAVERKSLKPYAYIAGGVGLLGVAGFATFGTLSANRYSDLEEDCPGGICPSSSQEDIESGKQMQLFANVGLGVGVAGIATSVVLFVLDAKRKNSPVEVQVGYRSVVLRGAF